MNRKEAEDLVEALLLEDPETWDVVAELREKGVSTEEIARRALSAARRIEREVM